MPMFTIFYVQHSFCISDLLLKLFPSRSTCFRNVFNEDLLVTNSLQFCLSENIFIELLLLKYIFATFKVSWHLIPFSVFIPWLWYQQSVICLQFRCFFLDDFKIFLSSVFSSLTMNHVLAYFYLCCLRFTELPYLRNSVFCYVWKTPDCYMSSFSFILSEPSCVIQMGCLLDLHLVIFSLLLLLLCFPFLFFWCIMRTFFASAFQFTHSLFNYI